MPVMSVYICLHISVWPCVTHSVFDSWRLKIWSELPFLYHNPRVWQTDGQTDGRTDISLVAKTALYSRSIQKEIQLNESIYQHDINIYLLLVNKVTPSSHRPRYRGMLVKFWMSTGGCLFVTHSFSIWTTKFMMTKSLYRMTQKTFRYLESFRRGTRVWRTDRRRQTLSYQMLRLTTLRGKKIRAHQQT